MSLLLNFKTRMMPVKCPTCFQQKMTCQCAQFADDKWDEEFMSDLGPNKLVCPESNSDEDSDYEDANAWEDNSPRLKF